MKPVALGTITSANLISQVWQNVYAVINTHVSDPKSRTKWIYAAFPTERKGTDDVFPCIIIDGARMDSGQFVMGSSKNYIWVIPISVYDSTMATCDSVSDSVMEQLESNKGSFTAYGAYQPLTSAAPTTHTILGKEVIHERRIELRLESVI